MPLSPGDKLGPYEIVAPIGKGGMGEVYRAHDPRLKRDVAIKVSAAQFSERFEREAQAIAALNHPNICQLYDVGPNYLVMEYIEGTPLEGPLPIDQALKFAAQICDALDAAHRKGITHRDLKPANILVTKTGIKLLDFGLAKLGTSGIGQAPKPDDATLTMALTGKNEIVGTLYYMSPEQLQSQATGKELDGRSDIFSFGIVLYEMLTGKRAFEGASPASVIAAIMERPAPSISDIAPPALDRVLKICLAKDPDERWQTARDLKRELDWIASGSGGAVPPSGTAAGLPPGYSRLGKIAMIAAGILAVALAGGSYVAYRATRPVEKPLIRLNVDLGPDAVAGVNMTVAISPDGKRIAFPVRVPGGKQQLATRLLDQTTPTLLAGTDNAADPFFSPDSQWIGFNADGKLKKISVLGGAAVALCDANCNAMRGASWGEDGHIIFALNGGIGLLRIPDSGGQSQALTKSQDYGDTTHRWPQILPGGNAVLFSGSASPTDGDNAKVEVLALRNGALKAGGIKVLARGGYAPHYLPAASGGMGHLVYLHEGVLLGVSFDPVKLELRGTTTPLVEDVAGNTTTSGGQFDVSRTGSLVYLAGKSGGANFPVMWLDSSGKTEPLLAKPGAYSGPRFSPDGNWLALSMNSGKGNDIYVYDWRHDTMLRLTFTGNGNYEPVWAPDGKHIVYDALDGLWWIRADGSGEPQRLLETKGLTISGSFSPDGKRLSYTGQSPGTAFDILTLPLDLDHFRR